MVSQIFLASVLALGLFETVQAIRTATQANAICNQYQAGYVAVMKPDGSDWGGCVPVSEAVSSLSASLYL